MPPLGLSTGVDWASALGVGVFLAASLAGAVGGGEPRAWVTLLPYLSHGSAMAA